MVVSNSPYIFKEKINDLFQGLDFISAYEYDHLVLMKDDWVYHLDKLQPAFNKLK